MLFTGILRTVSIQPCHLGFTQLTLLTAANKAESSIQAKHPMSEEGKSSLQASLLQAFALLSRMAEYTPYGEVMRRMNCRITYLRA